MEYQINASQARGRRNLRINLIVVKLIKMIRQEGIMSQKFILFIVMIFFIALPSMGRGKDGTVTLKAETKKCKVYALVMIGEHCDPVNNEHIAWVNYTKGTPIAIPGCGDISKKDSPYVVDSNRRKTINIRDAFKDSQYKQPNKAYPEAPKGPETYKLMVWREGLKDKPTFCQAEGHDMLSPLMNYDCTVSKIKKGRFDSRKTRCHCHKF